MDHKTTPNWAWPRSRDSIEILGPPYNFGTHRDIGFKFGIDIDDGPLLLTDHKTTPKWAWPGSRDQISKFRDALITFEGIEQSASDLAQT